MTERDRLVAAIAFPLSIAAITMNVTFAKNCRTADWLQLAMLTAVPLFVAVTVGVGAYAMRRAKGRGLPVVAGVSVGAATCYLTILLWIGACST
jgi:hypothetical protein